MGNKYNFNSIQNCVDTLSFGHQPLQWINKEEISIEQQNKRFSEENPLNAIKRILLCFMSLCFAEGNLIKSFFTRRSKSNKAGEKNSYRNMEPGFKLRNNHYFTIPGHQFILHVVYSPSRHIAFTYCFVIAHIVQKKKNYIKQFLLSRFCLSMVVVGITRKLKCPSVTQCQSISCLQQSHATPSLNLSPGIPGACSFYVEYREINLIFTWDWCALLTRPELINYMSNFEVSIQSQPSLEHYHFPKESGNNRRPGFSLCQLLYNYHTSLVSTNLHFIFTSIIRVQSLYSSMHVLLMIFRDFFIRIENFPAENNLIK